MASLLESQNDRAAFRRALMRWYDDNQRDLPWRKTADPYRIWVSEIMLQQTRVAAVLEHYALFITRFPSIEVLAAAKLDDVLAAWSGLGYYRRARAMHDAAKVLVAEFGGVFPRNASELRQLPGIGRYTAASVASIAFQQPVSVVDGNVERVLTRLLAADMLDKDAAWDAADKLLDSKRPGDWNQAMMELGATVCTPADPKCLTCPVRKHCGDPGRVTTRPKGERRKHQLCYGLARRNGSVYLVQRGAGDPQMASMWELPPASMDDTAAVLHRAKHSITKNDYSIVVIELKAAQMRGGRWVSTQKLSEVALTGLARKILRMAELM